jgi:nitrogen fixation NifU-like protein
MEKPFDFWQDHSEAFLIMANIWDKRKAMDRPDGFATKTGDCGDTVTISLRIKDGIISEINYELDGCINTNACCNALAVLTEGRTIEDTWETGPHDIIQLLETLPEDHHHCAELVIGTYYLALSDSQKERGREQQAPQQ